MYLLQDFREPFAIMLAATLLGCSAESGQALDSGSSDIPVLSAATDGTNIVLTGTDVSGAREEIPTVQAGGQPVPNQASEEVDSTNNLPPSGPSPSEPTPAVTDQEGFADALVYLSLDDSETDSTATDSSGNGNHGAIAGAVYSAVSADGSPFSLEFDGVDDGVSLGTLDVSGAGVTLAAWVNAETFPGTCLLYTSPSPRDS